MTDEVAHLVLRDNYEQNVAISNSVAQASSLLHVHEAYLQALERKGLLDRELEFLPSEKQLAQRRAEGIGLTAPEFSVLMAYTKIVLDRQVLASDLPDSEALRRVLHDYFPTPLRERYREQIEEHALRREIISTRVVNNVVNTAGTTFVHRLSGETGAPAPDILRAHIVAYDVFDLATYESAVEALDNVVPAAVQTRMRLEARRLAERGTRWLLQNRRLPLDISKQVAFFRDGVADVVSLLPKVVRGADLETMQCTRDELVQAGVPDELAGVTAAMNNAYSAFDIVEVSRDAARSVDEVADVYFYLADAMSMTTLLARINALSRDDRWKTMARAALREDLFSAHAGLTHDVLTAGESQATPSERFAAWKDRSAGVVARAQQTFEEIAESDTYDLAMMSVALRTFRTLLRSASRG